MSTTARGRKNPVETLCNRTVSANTGATGRTSPDVNIPPATPVETLCLSTVSARAKTAETRASRATAALEVRLPHNRPHRTRGTAYRTAHADPPIRRFPPPPPAARELSQNRTKTFAVFLAIARPEHDEKKHSRGCEKK
ncbi:hypothetical protein [Burkholderia multivorans]|uniref:hypothetical protein n=1 Tax=Burkholderia multivorans TaxID=87883 RepID=UPI0015E3BB9C|nr:hypothetical protein [Burkholderia multivorans]